jgi:hypothetical protein
MGDAASGAIASQRYSYRKQDEQPAALHSDTEGALCKDAFEL